MNIKLIKNISQLAFIGVFASTIIGCDIPEEKYRNGFFIIF